MNALQKLFQRLAGRLPPDELVALEAQYRADAAADSRASRQRTKERQARDRARSNATTPSRASDWADDPPHGLKARRPPIWRQKEGLPCL